MIVNKKTLEKIDAPSRDVSEFLSASMGRV